MDVTKLFDLPEDKRLPLSDHKLEMMINKAVSYPQIEAPANQNFHWVRRATAVAAMLALVIAISIQPSTKKPENLDVPSDAYEEISDLIIYETLRDLS